METAAQKSAASGGKDGASGGGGGQLCHVCGYKFASAHPSAKHRRAHKKNCGGGGGAKSPPAATPEVEEERQGKKLLLDECEGEAGEGNGAGASDSGGGLPGSARDVGNAVEDGDNGVQSSPNSAGVQVAINDVTSEVAPEAIGTEIQSTEVAVELSENVPRAEDQHPSESHVSNDQSQDASASHCQSEPEDGATVCQDLSADEITKSDGQSLASIAAAGEIVEGQSATTVDEDLRVNNLDVVTIEQIPSEETESKEESGVIGTGSVEQALRSEEPSTDKHVHADDTSSVDLSALVSGGCHLEAADAIETQQQTDPTSVVAEQLTNSKQAALEEEQSYINADEVIQAALRATGPADNTGDLTKKDPSEVSMEDGIKSDSSHTSGTIFMPSQTGLVEPSSDPTHEIDMISSKEDLDKNTPNENISADFTSGDTTGAQSVDIEETTSHETKALCSTDNIEDIKQIEHITAEPSLLESRILQSTCTVEEKEQIEEVIADPASYKVDVISSRDIVVEKEQSDVYVGTAQEINLVDIPANVELQKHDEETTSDPTASETDITNTTENVEEKKQIEETTTDPAHVISVIHSRVNDDKTKNEEMTEVPSFHENAVMNVKEKDEETTTDPTSYNTDAVSSVDVIGEKEEEEVTAEPTRPEINTVHTVDNVKEKESEEPAASCKTGAGSNSDSILAVDPSSHENNTLQGTDDAEEKNQSEEVAVVHAGDNIPATQSTDAEKKHKDETAAAEIKTTEGANGDHNEEITDKEMTIDSDKNHVSLKSLLSEKGMEVTKEKKATSTKDRVLSFRRRSSKDNPSPGKPGSAEQDWNSPARLLPVEKSPKGKKQPWMPFICCHSMNN